MNLKRKIILLLIVFMSFITINAQNVVLVVIDGARYTETFGDNTRQYIPKMSLLAEQGTYIDEFYNDGYTYTSRAIPALWCGTWTDVADTVYNGNSTQYTLSPSIFEYFEKQKNPGENKNVYTLLSLESPWLQSFHPEYGEDYWPTVFSEGNSDTEVLDNTLQIISDYHPQFLWVYLADVDHAGHSGNWDEYTGAIKIADSLVDVLWTALQNDPFYSDNTTMLVTNDHGRHTDDFSGHGCNCEGCRHIMLLALGDNIKQNYVSTQTRFTPDFAVTAASILDVDMEYAQGSVMNEIFVNVGTEHTENIDLEINSQFVKFFLEKDSYVRLEIFDLTGKKIQTIISDDKNSGVNIERINSNNLQGIFLIRLTTNYYSVTKKVFF